jgi:Zn ribbon nucleic-acid-binding protein
VTNVRQRSPFQRRVWEAYCPDCEQFRTLKTGAAHQGPTLIRQCVKCSNRRTALNNRVNPNYSSASDSVGVSCPDCGGIVKMRWASIMKKGRHREADPFTHQCGKCALKAKGLAQRKHPQYKTGDLVTVTCPDCDGERQVQWGENGRFSLSAPCMTCAQKRAQFKRRKNPSFTHGDLVQISCPDCGEYRELSWGQNGLYSLDPVRCHKCAAIARRSTGEGLERHCLICGNFMAPRVQHEARVLCSRGCFAEFQRRRSAVERPVHWAMKARCIFVACTDCGTIELVTESNLRGLYYRCLSCGIKHSFKHRPNAIATAIANLPQNRALPQPLLRTG